MLGNFPRPNLLTTIRLAELDHVCTLYVTYPHLDATEVINSEGHLVQCFKADNTRYFYQPWSACDKASARLSLSFAEAEFTRKSR